MNDSTYDKCPECDGAHFHHSRCKTRPPLSPPAEPDTGIQEKQPFDAWSSDNLPLRENLEDETPVADVNAGGVTGQKALALLSTFHADDWFGRPGDADCKVAGDPTGSSDEDFHVLTNRLLDMKQRAQDFWSDAQAILSEHREGSPASGVAASPDSAPWTADHVRKLAGCDGYYINWPAIAAAHNATLPAPRSGEEVNGVEKALEEPRDGLAATRVLQNALQALLNDEPLHGQYIHHVFCNASRSEPVGNSICSCPIGRRIKHLIAGLIWLDEFVEEPEYFPGDGDRGWWIERRQGIRDLVAKAILSAAGISSNASGVSSKDSSPSPAPSAPKKKNLEET